MRKSLYHFLILMLLVPAMFAWSCIRDEKPNIEVDVLEVTARTGNVLSVMMHGGAIDVYLAPGTDPAEVGLSMTLSPGATIVPDPELITGYRDPMVYRVTSEDGNWMRDYTVSARFSDLPRKFGFEHWTQPERMRYLIPCELTDPGEELHIWACGNESFNFLTNKNDDYTVFPTLPTADAGAGTWAAMLVTRLTGQLDRPIAAGNLFLGQFDSSLREPRESTMFGLPFMGCPAAVRGMYRYRSGGATLATGEPDACRIQAVLYRTDESVHHLNGFTIRTSPNIIARAELTGGDTAGSGYVPFEIAFDYTAAFDPAVSERGGYNLALVFTSSRNGDVYDGAPGSTLCVDEIEIICK